MDINLVALILGALVIVGAVLLLWRRQSGGLEVEFAKLFTLRLKLTPENTDSAREAVRAAGRERGKAKAELSSLGERPALARVLWVDDNPDYSVYETLALEELGKFITKATSTEAGLAYLGRMDFAAIITDLGRRIDQDHYDQDAGLKFIREVRKTNRRTPIIVYTSDASGVPDEVSKAGADAIVDLPNDLVDEVVRRTAG
jgi:CheY-like chemotaxis protein